MKSFAQFIDESGSDDHDHEKYKIYHDIFHDAYHHGWDDMKGGILAVNGASRTMKAYQASDKAPRSHRNALEKARLDVIRSNGAPLK